MTVDEIYDRYMSEFDAAGIKNKVVAWIRDWFAHNGKDCKAVIGISGGKDSSIVAALCVEALGRDRVFGVLMPQGTQSDIGDSHTLVEFLGIDSITVNIADVVSAVRGGVVSALEGSWSNQSEINLPPRIRMATLYAVSQTVGGRVANTCNLSEDFAGYSTRWGDSVGDFSPLASFTTDEVVAIGKACGLPSHLVEKIPADGLCGKTDEDNLGFSYRNLNAYIRLGYLLDKDVQERIERKHEANLFKLRPIPAFTWTNA